MIFSGLKRGSAPLWRADDQPELAVDREMTFAKRLSDESTTRWYLTISTGLLLGALVVYLVFGHRIIADAYHRSSPLPLVNGLINNVPWSPVAYYYAKADRLFIRIMRAGILAQLLGLVLLERGRVAALVRRFFNEASSPLNLAVFRIVLFLMVLTCVDTELIAWFNALPPELRHAPLGLGAIVSRLPVGQETARIGAVALTVACSAGLVGFCSRTSAAVVAMLGVYVLGIPNFYGKVGHYHHVVWFSAILAVSRCGDALSVDAVIAAWRRRRSGLLPIRLAPSRVYAVPLRWVWLLMGIIYFFPGYWKVWERGPEWFVGDQFRYILHAKWFELGGWTPLFRVDRYPEVCRVMGAAAILFELTFLFLVLFRRARPWVALAGQGFHTGTIFLMQISFMSLQACYVAFVDWAGLLRHLGLGRTEAAWTEAPSTELPSTLPVHVVGSALLIGNALLGLAFVESAWPLACYPTFAYPAGPQVSKTELVMISPSGGSSLLDDHALSEKMYSDRCAGMMNSVMASGSPERIRALWEVMARECKSDEKPSRIEVYRSTYLTDPDLRGDSRLVKREKQLEIGP